MGVGFMFVFEKAFEFEPGSVTLHRGQDILILLVFFTDLWLSPW